MKKINGSALKHDLSVSANAFGKDGEQTLPVRFGGDKAQVVTAPEPHNDSGMPRTGGTKSLMLPNIEDGAEFDPGMASAMRGWQMHESWHLRHSDDSVMLDASAKYNGGATEMLFRGLEDARVEHCGISEFPMAGSMIRSAADRADADALRQIAETPELSDALKDYEFAKKATLNVLPGWIARDKMGTSTKAKEILSHINPDLVEQVQALVDEATRCGGTKTVLDIAETWIESDQQQQSGSGSCDSSEKPNSQQEEGGGSGSCESSGEAQGEDPGKGQGEGKAEGEGEGDGDGGGSGEGEDGSGQSGKGDQSHDERDSGSSTESGSGWGGLGDRTDFKTMDENMGDEVAEANEKAGVPKFKPGEAPQHYGGMWAHHTVGPFDEHPRIDQLIRETFTHEVATNPNLSGERLYHFKSALSPSRRSGKSVDAAKRDCTDTFERQLVPSVQSVVNVASSKLRRAIMSTQRRRWQGNMVEGKLRDDRLVDAALGGKAVRSQRRPKPALDTAISLVVDRSGSMKSSNKIQLAAQACYVLAAALDQMVPVNVRTFCSNGREIREQWSWSPEMILGLMSDRTVSATSGQTEMPLIKGFDQSVRHRKAEFGLMYTAVGGGNNDPLAIHIAREELLRRPEKRKIMIVLSDGRPSGGNTIVTPFAFSKEMLQAVLQLKGNTPEQAMATARTTSERDARNQVTEFMYGQTFDDPEKFFKHVASLAGVRCKRSESGYHTFQMGANLRYEVRRTTEAGIELFGLGILDDSVKSFYPDYAVLDSVDDISGTMIDKVCEYLLGHKHRSAA